MTCDSLDAPGARLTERSPWCDCVFRMLTHLFTFSAWPADCVEHKRPGPPIVVGTSEQTFENCDRNHKEMQAPLGFLCRVRGILRLIHRARFPIPLTIANPSPTWPELERARSTR